MLTKPLPTCKLLRIHRGLSLTKLFLFHPKNSSDHRKRGGKNVTFRGRSINQHRYIAKNYGCTGKYYSTLLRAHLTWLLHMYNPRGAEWFENATERSGTHGFQSDGSGHGSGKVRSVRVRLDCKYVGITQKVDRRYEMRIFNDLTRSILHFSLYMQFGFADA